MKERGWTRVAFVTVAVLCGGMMAGIAIGCGPSLGPSKAIGALTAQEARGRAVYQQDCASCHYANQTGDLHGPSLFAMYRKKYLPSGAPANDARVAPVIEQGRNMMPGFGNQLNDQQLQDLLAYLHTL
ncbi:MAG TPA: cytochrome c [Acidobacteriaceae bacterium]|nr:cytochrome c [Acidobacteriaceae bacterium]